MHELLALVYYDSLQSVVPFYDQRSVLPFKDATWTRFCENSMKHFKKAFAHRYSSIVIQSVFTFVDYLKGLRISFSLTILYRQDWQHAFYMGKLSEKLGHSYEISLSYYEQAMTLNPTAVDPVYRMHASRLKLLNACGKQNLEALKVCG